MRIGFWDCLIRRTSFVFKALSFLYTSYLRPSTGGPFLFPPALLLHSTRNKSCSDFSYLPPPIIRPTGYLHHIFLSSRENSVKGNNTYQRESRGPAPKRQNTCNSGAYTSVDPVVPNPYGDQAAAAFLGFNFYWKFTIEFQSQGWGD